jgi:hypothetical protein
MSRKRPFCGSNEEETFHLLWCGIQPIDSHFNRRTYMHCFFIRPRLRRPVSTRPGPQTKVPDATYVERIRRSVQANI